MNFFQTIIVPNIIIIAFYVLTLVTSGIIVRAFLKIVGKRSDEVVNKAKYDTGFLIGKCENIITLSLVLLNEYTALALIFSAKSIVRASDIKNDPMYYLGGTLINFTYSLIMGLIIRFCIYLYQYIT